MEIAELKIPLSSFDRFIENAGILAMIILWVLSIYSYLYLQEIIPIHFNIAGQVTKWGEKTTLLFFPITATVIFVGLTMLNRYPRYFKTINQDIENSQTLKYSIQTLRILKLSIAVAFCLIILFIHVNLDGLPTPLGPWFLPLMLAVIILPMGYHLVKLLLIHKS